MSGVNTTSTPAVTNGAWRTAAAGLALFAAVGIAAYAALNVPRDLGRVTPIWVANALAVACVLRAPGRLWLWVAAGFAGNIAADLAVGNSVATSLALSACNTLEVLICGLGVLWAARGAFDPGRMDHLAKGAGLAFAASFASALASAVCLGLLQGRHFASQLTVWTLADWLGLLILVPCLLILAGWRRYAAERPIGGAGWAVVAGALALEVAVFWQTRYPLLFLVIPATLTTALALEILGAAIMVLATAALAVGFTFAGRGPIALASAGWTEQLILLQVFVVICSCLSLQVGAMQQHRRRGAERLAAALADAEQAARVKSEFLANMSHEIRTPLTSILGFAALLAERKLDPEAGGHARRVLAASRNLLALVNDVLDFSKLEAGRLEIRRKPGSIEQCGRDVVDLFAAAAAEKGLAITFEGEALPAGVDADFDRVRQALMNLTSNAVRFTEAGRVTLTAAYDMAQGALSFRVADTGPGLDDAAQAKLFQRFSQVNASVSRAHGGSGLGLAISKGLVEAMDGRIGVDSRPGEGATFWFEIPAPIVEPGDDAGAGELDLAAFRGLRLLVVDDNAANRELVRSLLTPLGVALTTADGGEAAVALAEAQPFQLILMDLRMPGMDGWAAGQAIRQGAGPNRATPMLAFSADITADDEAALRVFQGVVRKPIEMAGLLVSILDWSAEPPADPAETPRASLRS